MKPFRIASLSRATTAFMLVALGAVAGCAGEHIPSDAPGGAGSSGSSGASGNRDFEGQDFESDSPDATAAPAASKAGGAADGATAGGQPSGAAGSTGSAPPGTPAGESDNGGGKAEAARAIEEADVIQVRGGILYALSRYSGLAIVDISQQDNLKLLGKKRLSGQPFEMYVRDNVAYAMFTAYGQYSYDEVTDQYQYVQTSHIAAIDITNPADLKTLGEFDLPGDISDSRIVGDVLYAVSYENGYCWKCDHGNSTTITSLVVSNPASIGIVDRLTFENPKDQYGGWGKRSVTATNERMYVAGVEYGNGNNQGSTIQVVDISDATGKLVKGASIAAKGMIESRWQMDEFDGNLRVISQPGWWSTSENPAMQTFKIESSQKLDTLAVVDLKLPQKNERLRSVRFDGKRGYAITAEQKDPLFTLDFSDPKAPKQVGELEMPGFVYHLEPRGDRVLGLGYDNGNAEGSLHVSLFDVSDFANPKMLSRVPFGGTWSSLAEDQDRIHKAFNILPEQGLIMVPFSATTYNNKDTYSCPRYESGIQLIDYKDDTLTKRGVAPQKGDARRAFLANDRLFAVSDDAVRSFDISDRDAPKQTAQQNLANKVNRTIPAGDKVVRLSMDWYTASVSLEVASAAEPDSFTPLGAIDITSQKDKDKGCYSSWGWGSRVFAVGNTVHIIGPANDQYGYYYGDGPGGGGGGQKKNTQLRVVSIDISDSAAPKVVSDKELDLGDALNQVSWGYGYGYGGYYGYGGNNALVDTGDSSVQIGSTVVFRRQKTDYKNGQTLTSETALEVFDLSNPIAPKHAATVQLAKGAGATSLLSHGTTVLTSHWEKQPGGKVKFYVDRVDVAKPSEPQVLARWNVPGSLAGFDPVSKQVVTVDYTAEVYADKQVDQPYGYGPQWQNCYEGSQYYYGEGDSGGGKDDGVQPAVEPNYEPVWGNYQNHTCVRTHRSFKLARINDKDKAALVDTQAFPTSGYLDGIRLGDARLFTVLRSQSQGARAFTLGIGGATLESSEIVVEEANKKGGYYNWGNTYIVDTAGTRALLVKYGNSQPKLYSLDTKVLGAPSYKAAGELTSWFSEARIEGNNAICSLGEQGVQVVALPPQE